MNNCPVTSILTIPDGCKGYWVNPNGYARISLRTSDDYQEYVHRAVVSKLAGYKLPNDKVVHHMDFDKLHNCPSNLLVLDTAIHDACCSTCKDPYTGQFMSRAEYKRRYRI